MAARFVHRRIKARAVMRQKCNPLRRLIGPVAKGAGVVRVVRSAQGEPDVHIRQIQSARTLNIFLVEESSISALLIEGSVFPAATLITGSTLRARR